MATVPVTCPYCGVWIRVAVQPSKIIKPNAKTDDLYIKFDDQEVAHVCKKKEI